MGNTAVAVPWPGTEELDELFRLDASETGPEDDDEDNEDNEGDGSDDEGDVEPEEMPHP